MLKNIRTWYLTIFVPLLICMHFPLLLILGYGSVQFRVTDSHGNPLVGGIVTLETQNYTYVLPTVNETGIVQSIDLIPQGTYHITVKWKSPYLDNFITVFSDNIKIEEPYIFELKTMVFPIIIKLITPNGKPLNDTPLFINGRAIGLTRGYLKNRLK